MFRLTASPSASCGIGHSIGCRQPDAGAGQHGAKRYDSQGYRRSPAGFQPGQGGQAAQFQVAETRPKMTNGWFGSASLLNSVCRAVAASALNPLARHHLAGMRHSTVEMQCSSRRLPIRWTYAYRAVGRGAVGTVGGRAAVGILFSPHRENWIVRRAEQTWRTRPPIIPNQRQVALHDEPSPDQMPSSVGRSRT